MRVLAVDIGGTKSLLGLCIVKNRRVETIHGLTKLVSADFRSLSDMIHHWQNLYPSEAAFTCIGAGVAGPVLGGHVHLTNLGWDIDADEIARAFGNPVKLCNDMVSHSFGVLGVESENIITLNAGRPAPGPKVLIAAGTGLGEAIIGWDGSRHIPMAGEGGHASFAATNDLESELLEFLRRELHGHVSWERILGGRDGFRHLAQLLAHHRSISLPSYLSELANVHADCGPALIQAYDKGDPFAADVIAIYATLYGREAANLALKCVPTAGVYVGGGIAPRILNSLHQHFMHGFTDKGRFSELLRSIPVYVITDPLNGLKGAALQFADSAN